MSNMMRALVKAKAEPGIWMEEVPVPEIGPNDVLIKVRKSAICGTDVHIYNWDEWAQKTVPVRLSGAGGQVTGVEFERGTERFTIDADMVLKAIGQTLVQIGLDHELLTLDGSRIATDENRQTTLAKVWAGGDCATHEGPDLTVQAVQDGKLAAASIDASFAPTAIRAACPTRPPDTHGAEHGRSSLHDCRHHFAEPFLARVRAAHRQGL